jgi:predicted dehydrogenase
MDAGILNAAILGLGKVAWTFDEEPGRRVVWTHAGAYRAMPHRFRLVAATDLDPATRAAFQARFPDVRTGADSEALVRETAPEIVSICTPAATHRAALDAALGSPRLRLVWCEKPLALSLEDARAMVEACERRGVRLLVNHVRRWVPLWRRLAQRIAAGEIGQVRCVRVAMPNRLWSVGSHAVDLALMLGGPATKVVQLDVPSLEEMGEPARPALIGLSSGAYAIVGVTGLMSQLIVEGEVTGDRGRLRAREDRGEIAYETFVGSQSYTGYQELGPPTVEHAATLAGESPFVALAAEIATLIDEPNHPATCDGRMALETMRVLDLINAQAPQ